MYDKNGDSNSNPIPWKIPFFQTSVDAPFEKEHQMTKERKRNISYSYKSKQLKENYNNAKGSIVHVVFVKMILMAQTVGKFHFLMEI